MGTPDDPEGFVQFENFFKGPSGRMGTPDDPEGFVQFEVGDLTVYVARELLEKLKPGADRMPFYIWRN